MSAYTYVGKVGLFVGILNDWDVRRELRDDDRPAPGDGTGQFGEFAKTFEIEYKVSLYLKLNCYNMQKTILFKR